MATAEPAFRVTLRDGDFEVREYAPLVAAEVNVSGTRDEASGAGFRLLAGYIFGANTRRQKIAMTAPVAQQAASQTIAMTAPVTQTGAPGGWTVRFMMPAGASLETLPAPNDERVHLIEVATTHYAVVRFSGLARAEEVERETAALKRFVETRHLEVAGQPTLARYNPPWTPWFMRRNEVWIPLRSETAP